MTICWEGEARTQTSTLCVSVDIPCYHRKENDLKREKGEV